MSGVESVLARSMTICLPQASQFGPGMPLHGQFWQTFWPSVTANVGFWAVSEATSWPEGGSQSPSSQPPSRQLLGRTMTTAKPCHCFTYGRYQCSVTVQLTEQ